MDSKADYFDNGYSDCDEAEDDNGIVGPDEHLPTVEELMATSSGNNEEGLTKLVPIHRPYPTPKEWRREGEHTLLSVPETAQESIEKGRQLSELYLNSR